MLGKTTLFILTAGIVKGERFEARLRLNSVHSFL